MQRKQHYNFTLLQDARRVGITDSKIKVTAEIFGRIIQDKLRGKLFKGQTLLKSDQAVTMKVLKKGIIIAG